jgi:2-methylisocitrate lyase-like PEP mutase family enzyme
MNAQLKAKADSLLAMHNAPPMLILPNAWDAITARIFEKAGARAIATTSAGIAAALGFPDGQKVPRDLMLEVVARIAIVLDVPVTADLEAGYGASPEDVAETTHALIRAGAVGFNLEDATGDSSNPLFEIEAQVARIRAAREAAKKAGLYVVINARTDVFLAQVGEPATRLRETLRRANAYRDAGADCLFVPGVTDSSTITEFVRAINGPLNVLAGAGTPYVSELQRIGVARLSVGSGIMRATLALARDAANQLLENGTYSAFLDHAVSYREVNELMQPRSRTT